MKANKLIGEEIPFRKRIGQQDYLYKMLENKKIVYKHFRKEKNTIVLMKSFEKVVFTTQENIIIAENQLYEITELGFISKSYTFMKPFSMSEESHPQFFVRDIVHVSLDGISMQDTLCFNIDVNDKITSSIYSSYQTEKYLKSEDTQKYSYETIVLKRKSELLEHLKNLKKDSINNLNTQSQLSRLRIPEEK